MVRREPFLAAVLLGLVCGTNTVVMDASDYSTLNDALTMLRSPAPLLESYGPANRSKTFAPDVIAISGNWYDGAHKLAPLVRAATQWPSATLLLTGGRAERLTSPAAVQAGGEPLLLRSQLLARGVVASRLVVWSGSRITVHNLQAMLAYVRQKRSFERARTRLLLLEECVLVRRVAAQLGALLRVDPYAREALEEVRVRPCGARSFRALVAAHGGRADVALAMLLGEVDRIERYSEHEAAGGGSSGGGGGRGSGSDVGWLVLSPSARLGDPALETALRALAVRHARTLASGQRLLADRHTLLAAGGLPRATSDV